MKELSRAAGVAWDVAASETGAAAHPLIEREHLLIGILSLDKAVALLKEKGRLSPVDEQSITGEHRVLAETLSAGSLDAKRLRREVRERTGRGEHVHDKKTIHRSETVKALFRRADEITGAQLTTLHLLAALCEDPGEIVASVLGATGASVKELRDLALAATGRVLAKAFFHAPAPNGSPDALPTVETYGRNLTRLAQEGEIGPLIGPRREMRQVLQTLAHRSKNNPVLLGEAGVGKTAIAEAVALRAAQGKDPKVLGDRRFYELNVGALLSGTKSRSELEERIAKLLRELGAHPEVVVFIDAIHDLLFRGGLLRSALARGEIRCIAATTIAEYRRTIESDPELDRRFEKILVPEPSRDEALEILSGLRPNWEKRHRVRVTLRALAAAVDLSARFDSENCLPEKAIDLVEKAAARARIPALRVGAPATSRPDCVGEPEEPRAHLPLGVGRERLMQEETPEVTETAIAQALGDKMRVPIDLVTSHLAVDARARLLKLEPFLKERLKGQDQAARLVSERLLASYSGVRTRRGPLATLLFVGPPTVVGKTEMARLLAEFLFGDDSNLIRLDMGEYTEEQSVSKLIGELVSKLRSRPHALVLLDEAEKAHPHVFDLFLQLFDQGRLTDAKGRTADVQNAVFVLTSSLGEIRSHFRAELLSRIDEVVVFERYS